MVSPQTAYFSGQDLLPPVQAYAYLIREKFALVPPIPGREGQNRVHPMPWILFSPHPGMFQGRDGVWFPELHENKIKTFSKIPASGDSRFSFFSSEPLRKS